MRCFVLGTAGFVVAAIAIAIAMASYGDYEARASLSQVMAAVAPLKEELGAQLIRDRRVADAAALKSLKENRLSALTDYLKVAADGTIVLRSAKHGQVVVLEPSLRGDQLTWRCVGSKPENNIPAECR